MGQPKITPLDLYYQAGINPKTGLPVKLGGSKETLKMDIRKFLRLVDELGFCKDGCPIIYNDNPQKLSYEIGYDGCKKLFEENDGITAVLGTNDLVAIGIMRALKDLGYSVPNDVCVVGCDDTMISRNYIPTITSIQFDKGEHGRKIAQAICLALLNTIFFNYICNSVAVIIRANGFTNFFNVW